MKTFPKLYKKTKTGAVQQWEILVTPAVVADGDPEPGGCITTRYGQVDGALQVTQDLVRKGKNAGRSNATTALQQAEAEARARWERQVKKGYVESLERAQAGDDDVGGVLPMLAHVFDDHGHKIQYPAFMQPKLDGIRCVAIVEKTGVRLFSRTRKPITSVPHIEAEILRIIGEAGVDLSVPVVLDGELYNHELKNDFEKIVSAVRKQEPSEESLRIQYHVYDMVSPENYAGRLAHLVFCLPTSGIVQRVETQVASAMDVLKWYDHFVEQGYEGAMIRSARGGYEHGRSYALQKVKRFLDAEFDIIAVQEGRGKMAGKAIFICVTPNGEEFAVKLKGELESLEKYLQDANTWVGKRLTVQYQGLSAYGVPRFPVGLRIREDE
jgi:DNA ligase-1